MSQNLLTPASTPSNTPLPDLLRMASEMVFNLEHGDPLPLRPHVKCLIPPAENICGDCREWMEQVEELMGPVVAQAMEFAVAYIQGVVPGFEIHPNGQARSGQEDLVNEVMDFMWDRKRGL